MHLELVLLYVGAVLTLNGIWLLGKIEDKEIWIINVFSGLITLSVAAYAAFGKDATASTVHVATLTLLFSITYFWVAINRFLKVDGRGLGWFSLFVAITIIPVAFNGISGTDGSGFDLLLQVSWAIWAVLWFMYFLLLGLGKNILNITGWATVGSGIVTGWIPAIIMIANA